jgi:hypothetical protein
MGNYNFTHYKGDTFEEQNFKVIVNLVPLNLTGSIIRMQLKKEFEGISIYEFSSVAGNARIVITNALLGEFKFINQVIDIPAFNYIYDIQIILSDSTVKTWVNGNFRVSNDVTR